MKQSFGNCQGKEVFLYTIENEKIRFSVTDYGASLVSLEYKPCSIDTVEGYDNVDDYMRHDTYLGASIGRTANRIEKGIFTLNGITYHIPVNNNGNANHGGIHGFDKKIFDTQCSEHEIVFTYTSMDGEEGYPGTLHVKITYRLLESGIAIVSEGRAEQDTLFAYTNHSYFNLDESQDAMQHTLMIPSDRYALLDETCLTLNRTSPVSGTPFDFTTPKEIGQDIDCDDIQLTYGAGYDHHYPIAGKGMRKMAVLAGQKLTMTMSSDFPGFHLYTANWLNGAKGKKGHVYPRRSAVCLEAEYCPNAVNYADMEEKPVVRAGETLRHEIRYEFSEKEG
ncbi:MAG: aldose epimerase family protein [Bulleidia sp.]